MSAVRIGIPAAIETTPTSGAATAARAPQRTRVGWSRSAALARSGVAIVMSVIVDLLGRSGCGEDGRIAAARRRRATVGSGIVPRYDAIPPIRA